MSFRTPYAVLLAAAALCFCQVSLAIDADEVIDPSRSSEGASEGSSAMQGILSGNSASSGALITLIGYAVVIGAVAVVVWYLFKSGFMRKSLGKEGGKLKIAETRMLGNRQFISVVEYGDQKILIGVGPGKIDYLTTLQNSSGEFPQIEASSIGAEQGGQA
ncbi:flagellar biosynthetic protein FliO [Pelagicoccus mobilis]|uniref:Flagellar biosynthetic protein FliO n=1 Tax=Pelagicoccus mobilis TaxID=415221 RepID=A0A934RXM8_9BACT|nr:flagellar biosynthetic protein FliO [Pelagicoccus mobilis]MBK1878441.1 flagellar biosynthetic protein FliO [Pelagicoccus mobilis]